MIYEPKSAAKAVKQRARKAVQYNEGADEDTSGAAAGGEQGHGAAGCCGEQGHRWQGLQDGHGAGPGEAASGHERDRGHARPPEDAPLERAVP